MSMEVLIISEVGSMYSIYRQYCALEVVGSIRDSPKEWRWFEIINPIRCLNQARDVVVKRENGNE